MLIFNLWHKKEKKKIREYKTIHVFTKRIEYKTNDGNNNKKKKNDDDDNDNNNNFNNNNNNNNKTKTKSIK